MDSKASSSIVGQLEHTKDNHLLMLGLELLKTLNKSTKVPYAVVKPRVQPSTQETTEEDPKTSVTPLLTGNVRKRKHNAEISEAEKKEKRRMMNRMAAQNARDRKKQYMEEMEKKLARLEEQNKLLTEENKKLKEHTANLETERVSLRNRLGQHQEQLGEANSNGSIMEDSALECFTGSAVSTVSQQQKHTPAPVLQTYLAVSLISWIYCMKNWQGPLQLTAPTVLNSFVNYQQHQMSMDHLPPLPMTPSSPTRKEMWWGAHNPGWNPPMN